MPDNSQTPAQKLAEDISSIQSNLNSLQDDVRLARLRDEMATIDNSVNRLPELILDLRSQGYVYECELDAEAAGLKQRWASQRLLVLQQINQQSIMLDMDMRQIETIVSQLVARSNNPYGAQPFVSQAKAQISSLESKINAVEGTIRGMFRAFNDDANKMDTHLKKIDWSLKQLAQATFQLMPDESLIMAVKATWVRSGKETKEDPEGVLYLSDQRLFFEQKQEIATKKVLFVTTARQMVHKLMAEMPVPEIEMVNATKQGLFKNEDHIEIHFSSHAPFQIVYFHLDGQDCNAWQGLLNRARTRDFDKGRAVPIDQEAVEKVKAAPTQCPVCGGAITAPVLRGMDTITCEFCGNVIRI